jgi:hypothetical protein
VSHLKRAIRLFGPLTIAAGMVFGFTASVEAASPYQQVCNGSACIYHSHHVRKGALDYYVSSGATPITHFNIRNRNGTQIELAAAYPIGGHISKASTLHNVKPGGKYTISIQACYKRFLSSSSCSAWRAVTITAPKEA